MHLPIKEPSEWLDRVPDDIAPGVPRHYVACVMHLDDAVGRIVKALEAKGVRDNTLIVFTSDNGGSTVENNDLKYPDDNCPNGRLTGNNKPLRGQKGDVYEGGTRVPTLVSWPGKAKPGRVQSPVQIIDWMPTFCSLAGYKPQGDLKWGRHRFVRAAHQPYATPADRPIYTAGLRWRASSLRMGDWKLITHGTGDQQRSELYNIADDIGESNNLADRNPKKVNELLKQLESVAAADRDAVVN